ncbi:MAG TPA: hypothetical protein VHB98_19925 [Chloroflexota bacterium]|nr:hypothetical protein [Chloroflexota bacterium]
MKRRIALIGILLGLSLALGSAALTTYSLYGATAYPSTVYSASTVTAGLLHHPRAWIGRTVLVRGTVLGSSWDPDANCSQASCAGTTSYALAASLNANDVGQPALIMVTAPPSWLTSTLSGMPFLQRFVPQPQAVQFLRATTYRVRLQAIRGACDRLICVNAVLLDATP